MSRPQCNRVAMTLVAQADYTTAVANGSITQKFEPTEPVLLGMTQERTDDSDLIKGHEFPEDVARDTLVSQDIQIPFSFPSSLEVIGILLASAYGAVATTGSVSDFVHTFLPLDLCTTDQPEAVSWVLGVVGDTASNYKVKGLILNDINIASNGKNWLNVTGTAYTDGSRTVEAGFSWPAASAATDFIVGTQMDFLTADYGATTLVSKQSKLRGFEFGYSNNLDLADARSTIAGGVYLSSLRPGDREFTLSVTVEGHQGDEFWQDFEGNVTKDVQIHVEKGTTRYLDIRAKKCKIASITQSFDGIRDINTITYKMFWEDQGTSQEGPCMVQLANGVAGYLT